MTKHTMRLLPAMLLLAYAGLAPAAGFQALEQNASGLGTAYAGSAAIADSAATMFANPAGLTRLAGFNVSLGAVGVAESYKFQTTAGVSSGGDAGNTNVLPNAYISWQAMPGLNFGFGVSRPFLNDIQYNAGWVGAADGIKSEITTLNLNPAVAYQVNDKVSLGLGLNYQQLDMHMTATGGAFKGDDSALGWNAGALFTLSPAMRVGIAYRSKIDHDVAGLDVDTPASVTLSVWQQVSDHWEAMGDLSYTHWSGVDDTDFDNSWRIAWGTAYKLSDVTKLKFGVAYERSPVGTSNRPVQMPDSNRLWLSLGGQWKFGRASLVDVGYAYRYMRDAKINDGAAVGKYENSAHVLGVQYTVGF